MNVVSSGVQLTSNNNNIGKSNNTHAHIQKQNELWTHRMLYVCTWTVAEAAKDNNNQEINKSKE